MSTAYDTYPEEPAKPDVAADQEARMSAARAKADAARAAVERRRSSTTTGLPNGRSNSVHSAASGYGSDAVGSGELIIKRRPSASTPHISTNAATPLHPDGGSGAAPQQQRSVSPPAAAAHHHQQPPSDLDAAMAEIAKERAKLEANNDNLERRLQLYSEVIGLRKELDVVCKDEERLRKQLANAEAIVASNDPEVAKEVAIFEEEAQHSVLKKVWAEESERHNPDTMEWAAIDISRLKERVNTSRRKFTATIHEAEALYSQQEDAINEITDARDREKAALVADHEKEMEGLDGARAHARQVATEERFHRHRGTTRGRQNIVSKEQRVANRQRTIDQVEFKTTAQVSQMKDDLTELMEEVKVLKRQLDDTRKISEGRRRELEVTLKGVEEEGVATRELREKLSKEDEELRELKADLQGVLHYVRAKNREEETF